jgi:RimJ/RimL family protein N-acetyltransferase
MYKYEDVGFRPIEEKDLAFLQTLRNEQSTMLQLATIDMDNSLEQKKWWESLTGNNNYKRYVLVRLNPEEELIGSFRIQDIHVDNKHCEIGIDIYSKYRRQGHATKCYKMILEYLFLQKNTHMVYLRFCDFNEAGRKLYGKIGFKYSGKYPEYIYRHGKYWDYIIMVMLKQDFQKLLKGTT